VCVLLPFHKGWPWIWVRMPRRWQSAPTTTATVRRLCVILMVSSSVCVLLVSFFVSWLDEEVYAPDDQILVLLFALSSWTTLRHLGRSLTSLHKHSEVKGFSLFSFLKIICALFMAMSSDCPLLHVLLTLPYTPRNSVISLFTSPQCDFSCLTDLLYAFVGALLLNS
jgi:hypothetical protein